MNSLLKYVSFTRNETKVILFAVSVLAAGFSIKYYKHLTGTSSNLPYDFSKSDSEFREKSNNANRNKLSLPDINNSRENDLDRRLKSSDDSLSIRNNVNKQNNLAEILAKSLNINTATKEELIDLPGVGESTADKIIVYREEKKGFKKIEDLMKVKGIGKKKFEKIKEYITTE
ncbi:MAG: helix-hairpin-helix domain-containing protein [Bacteroidota bacterium]|nr:helix-hairpin-helix domain-containing protein [Bacteroidota bacterium]